MEAMLYGMNAGLGLSPHTLGMVLTASVHGRKNAWIFTLGALVFDTALILTVLFIQGQLEMGRMTKLVLHFISGLLIIRMGWKALGKRKIPVSSKSITRSSFKEGLVLQIFNPNPYIFWFMIGIHHMNFPFVLTFISVTYFIKILILEFSVQISKGDFLKEGVFDFFRKSVAALTMLNGVFITVQNGQGLWLNLVS